MSHFIIMCVATAFHYERIAAINRGLRFMSKQRVAAGVLSMLLLALLGWSLLQGVGDVRTQALLAAGACAGLLYTLIGRLPDWLMQLSGGKLVDDDDPGNLSPRVYLSVLGVALFVALIVLVVIVYVL